MSPKSLSDFSRADREWLETRARPLERKTATVPAKKHAGFRPGPGVVFRVERRDERGRFVPAKLCVEIEAGICPCACHAGEIMHRCDPASDQKGVGCLCCSGLCS
jgi:hypothetical protein